METQNKKQRMFFVDINIVANNREEVYKMLGKKAKKFISEIRDMGETDVTIKEVTN